MRSVFFPFPSSRSRTIGVFQTSFRNGGRIHSFVSCFDIASQTSPRFSTCSRARTSLVLLMERFQFVCKSDLATCCVHLAVVVRRLVCEHHVNGWIEISSMISMRWTPKTSERISTLSEVSIGTDNHHDDHMNGACTSKGAEAWRCKETKKYKCRDEKKIPHPPFYHPSTPCGCDGAPTGVKRKSRQDFICIAKPRVSPESNEKATSLAKRDSLRKRQDQ